MTDEITEDPTVSLIQETKAPEINSSDEPKAKRKYSRRKTPKKSVGRRRTRHVKRRANRGKRASKPTTLFVPGNEEGDDFAECFVGSFDDDNLFKTKADAIKQINADAAGDYYGVPGDEEPTILTLYEVKLVKTHKFKIAPAKVKVEEI